MNFQETLHKFNKILVPPIPIGGLQIDDFSIRFMEFLAGTEGQGFTIKSASLRLPPGIMAGGRIKDKPNLVSALKNIRNQIAGKKKQAVNVVLTIPDSDVYIEAFNLPALEGKNLDEAVNLNMQVISPNPIEKSYYGWSLIGDSAPATSQFEVLGVFASKDIIDEFTSVLAEAGFGIVAVEFTSLSLKRILTASGIVAKESSYLVVKVAQEGVVFMIIRNNNLYFNYFHPWARATDEKTAITLEQVKSILRSESRRLVNFYSSHYGSQIKKIILITPIFGDEIMNFLQVQYPDFEKVLLRSDKENLNGARGAALRAAVAAIRDEDINIMNSGAVSAFWSDKIFRFADSWRNIVVLTAVFILAVFGVSDLFIRSQAAGIEQENTANLSDPDVLKLTQLQAEAKDFNAAVGVLSGIRKTSQPVSPIITKINSAIISGVSIVRLSLKSSTLDGTIDGSATSQDAIINFKNRLSAVPGITDVDLPLSSIISQSATRWSFIVHFKIAPPA